MFRRIAPPGEAELQALVYPLSAPRARRVP